MKLIKIYQKDLIICDNKSCDYKIKNETGDFNVEIKQYINMPCPKCGENLLTQQDYDMSKRVRKTINWINKWFGWLYFFINIRKSKVHIHNGIKIK
jgi:hypothetical protein